MLLGSDESTWRGGSCFPHYLDDGRCPIPLDLLGGVLGLGLVWFWFGSRATRFTVLELNWPFPSLPIFDYFVCIITELLKVPSDRSKYLCSCVY